MQPGLPDRAATRVDRSGATGLKPAERDAVLAFAARARRIRAAAETLEDEPLRRAIAAAFELGRRHDPRRRQTPVAPRSRSPTPSTRAPSGVTARQKHFSASSLNAYAECPRKWFYRYACAAIEDPGSSAAAYGTAFHLALEDFHGEFPRPRARDDHDAATRRRVREVGVRTQS